ncbi:Acid phosphatase/vanadium-dependent haloperoxidase-related protein [Zea mays]|uniref:Acid phosphatase/vanadium-dependent haloperoxidase-related protein n=1 Tax=Zea mays TaxID=4577 RepID=A0A1D6E7W4_MAIZE|nr:Acid phosphatase/vanadium-dependent haloperoxidase-related protein [Zea mays]
MGASLASAGLVNYPLVAALLAFALAQSSKFFTTWYKEGRWDARQLIASGGMPSSHSATVTALSVAVGIQEGFRSATFATALVFACVVRTLLKLLIHF